jgi:cyclopropane fatty-acyl-phospholipid synthase-like methyltransferase
MAMSAVRVWFGKPPREPVEQPRPAPKAEPVMTTPGMTTVEPAEVLARPAPNWSRERLVITDALWGPGYQFPGGEIEALRLAKPLGLSAASSLLLLGAGAGGASCSLATKLGVWVSGFEADANLLAAGVDRIARRNMTKRAQMETWNPAEPDFGEHAYHHALALEPLRASRPEAVLSAIARALKPNGQIMLTELVADVPLDPADPSVAAWARMEHRDPACLATEVSITRILGRLGFDVRIAEDVSQRHVEQTLTAWRTAVRSMEHVRPSPRQAVRSVHEAELWLLRLRLFERGNLRLMRWHGIGGGELTAARPQKGKARA